MKASSYCAAFLSCILLIGCSTKPSFYPRSALPYIPATDPDAALVTFALGSDILRAVIYRVESSSDCVGLKVIASLDKNRKTTAARFQANERLVFASAPDIDLSGTGRKLQGMHITRSFTPEPNGSYNVVLSSGGPLSFLITKTSQTSSQPEPVIARSSKPQCTQDELLIEK